MTIITTQRLVLRPPLEQDIPDIVRELNNLAVSRWTSRIPFPYGEDDARRFLAWIREAGPDFHLHAIALDGRLIGVIGDEEGEIGYWLAEPFWGRGIGGEAARAVADHAFEALGRERMIASYQIGNHASRRILLGLGFAELGESQSHSLAQGIDVPIMRLKLTRNAWQAAKGQPR